MVRTAVVAGAVLLAACTSSAGPAGPQGLRGETGPQGLPGTPGTTTFAGLTDVPPALVAPFPNGPASQIVSSVKVTARADCGSVAPIPHFDVYVDGQFIGGSDVTSASYAEVSPVPVVPQRFAREVAVAFTNDSSAGGCDHNLYVQQIAIGTPTGTVTIPAYTAHAIFDKGAFFDGVDVDAPSELMAYTGALRFFLGQ